MIPIIFVLFAISVCIALTLPVWIAVLKSAGNWIYRTIHLEDD